MISGQEGTQSCNPTNHSPHGFEEAPYEINLIIDTIEHINVGINIVITMMFS
jgi:hypothetical protein